MGPQSSTGLGVKDSVDGLSPGNPEAAHHS
jgi:hypothetical protein